MYILNHYGTLVNVGKADCIRKTRCTSGDCIVYRIETENEEGDGYILGEYKTREEMDKAYENMMVFLNAMDMHDFEEERHE